MRATWFIVYVGKSRHEEPHGIADALSQNSLYGQSVVVEDNYTEMHDMPTFRAALEKKRDNQKFVVMTMEPEDAERIRKTRTFDAYQVVSVQRL